MRPKARTVSRSFFILFLLVVCTALAQDFQIRTRVDLVVVPVTVKGADDRLVTGLTKDDFIVLEDGRRQTISNFTDEPVPLSAAIVVDTGLPPNTFSRVQESIPALAGAFSDADEVAVYRYDKYVARLIDFTTDKLVAQSAMSIFKEIEPTPHMIPSGPFSIPGPMVNGQAVVPAPTIGLPVPPQTRPAQVLHDAIFQAGSDLATRAKERRKMVLLISSGRASQNDHSYDEVVGKLLETGVEIYAVGMDYAFVGRETNVLSSYAKDTGGSVCYVNSLSALEACYARSAVQARNQYVLGYISNNQVSGILPVFRNIQVQLTGGNYETLHRKGYYQYP